MAIPAVAAAALRTGVPLATDAFKKYFPQGVAQAKEIVAKAMGTSSESINLKAVSQANNGAQAQLVAEAMVKAGYPVNNLFADLGKTALSNEQLLAWKQAMIGIQQKENAESDAAAIGEPGQGLDIYVKVAEKRDSLIFLMKMLGTNDINEVWRFKVEMDHLHQVDIQGFGLTNLKRN